jgi:hypothetical protein
MGRDRTRELLLAERAHHRDTGRLALVQLCAQCPAVVAVEHDVDPLHGHQPGLSRVGGRQTPENLAQQSVPIGAPVQPHQPQSGIRFDVRYRGSQIELRDRMEGSPAGVRRDRPGRFEEDIATRSRVRKQQTPRSESGGAWTARTGRGGHRGRLWPRQHRRWRASGQGDQRADPRS